MMLQKKKLMMQKIQYCEKQDEKNASPCNV